MKTPQPTAIGAGKGGIVPPVEHRFKPGNRANPGGHPKGFFPISRAYEDLLSWPVQVTLALAKSGVEAEIPEKFRKKLKASHLIAAARFATAANAKSLGGTAAAVEIADRTEGKVTQKTETVSTSFEDAVREVHDRMRAMRENPE